MAQGYGYRSEQRLRKENQDTLGVFEFNGFTLIVVCDGMGGHVGGRQASSLAVRTMHDELKGYTGTDVRSALRRGVEAANRAIYEAARKNYRLMGMGTTCVAAIVQGTTAHVAHVGDSRAYLLREGQLRALTRDHTMVNLFVDAELLSPEDAATHPEAHVLSRSLGVERQVEVDLGEPLTLAQGDRILLCSDGIHGVVGNAGLASLDWRNPQEGVDAALDAVIRAEGDDNATLVALGIGISGTSAPVTEPPDLSALEDEARAAPMQVPLNKQRRPTLVPNGQGADQDVVPVEALGDEATELDHPTPVVPMRRGSGGNRPNVRMLAMVGGLGAVGIAALAMLFVVFSSPSGPTRPSPSVAPTPPSAVAAIQAPPQNPTSGLTPVTASVDMGSASDEPMLLAGNGSRGMYRSRCLDGSLSNSLPSAAAYLSSANDPEAAVAFYAPEVPPAPRRLPNTQSVYDHPPPSGPDQTKAVRAARNKRCREAIDTVRDAITKSIDYASLYGAAWYCFNDTHANTLARSRAATWDEFKPLLEHFEGNRVIPAALLPDPVAATAAVTPPTPSSAAADAVPPTPDVASGLPDQPDAWKVPAAGGVEYRLALFEIDDEVQGFRAIIIDLLGEATVADHLATDVLLIATAAASSARMEEPTPEALQVWARRVYVASRAMTGPVGELVRAHRPEVAGMIEALLFEATGGDEGLLAIEEGFSNEAVPPLVARAQAAGLAGQMEDVMASGSSEGLLPPVDMASLEGGDGSDVPSWRRQSAGEARPSRRSSGYAARRRSEVEYARNMGDPSQFDWENFGYLKVWYPRQRIPRVLLPYQKEGQADAGAAESEAAPRFDEVETFRGTKEAVDADWSSSTKSKP